MNQLISLSNKSNESPKFLRKQYQNQTSLQILEHCNNKQGQLNRFHEKFAAPPIEHLRISALSPAACLRTSALRQLLSCVPPRCANGLPAYLCTKSYGLPAHLRTCGAYGPAYLRTVPCLHLRSYGYRQFSRLQEYPNLSDLQI